MRVALTELGLMLARGGRGPVGPVGPGRGAGRLAVFPWWLHLVEMALVGLFVILVVLIVVWATRRRPVGPVPAVPSPALAEIDLRYARGEIDHEDYLTRRANLLGHGAPATSDPANTAEPRPEPPS